jgi:hypothetical protein
LPFSSLFRPAESTKDFHHNLQEVIEMLLENGESAPLLLDTGEIIGHCAFKEWSGRLGKGCTMERVKIGLSELTLAQKLDLMEALWNDLAKNEETLESPGWHEQVLRDREEALASGSATVSDWEEAKDRIREKVSCE